MNYGKAAPDALVQLNSQFRLEINGIQVMAFEEVEISDLEWNEGMNRTGIDPLTKQTFSGTKKPGEVKITKHERAGGAEDVDELIDWYSSGSSDRRSGAIIQLDRDGAEVRRMNFRNAWIKKYTPVKFAASADSDPAVHVFTLSVPEVTRG